MSQPNHWVEELEAECERALQSVVDEHLDAVPSRTVHLMAKAAVAVLEAVVEDEDE